MLSTWSDRFGALQWGFATIAVVVCVVMTIIYFLPKGRMRLLLGALADYALSAWGSTAEHLAEQINGLRAFCRKLLARNVDEATTTVQVSELQRRGIDIPRTDDEAADIKRVMDQILAISPREVPHALQHAVTTRLPHVHLYDLHSVDYVSGEYFSLATPSEGSLAPDCGYCPMNGYALISKKGVVASTFCQALSDPSGKYCGEILDDVRNDQRYIPVMPGILSEATRPIMFKERPILVHNLESRTPRRFTDNRDWVPVLDRLGGALQQEAVVRHLLPVILPTAHRLCIPNDYIPLQSSLTGILEVANRASEGARRIVDTVFCDAPEMAVLFVFPPGSRKTVPPPIRGLALSRHLERERAAFEASIAAYQPDVSCPTGYAMRDAELARLRSRGRMRPVGLETVDPRACSCVPPEYTHDCFVRAPIVSHHGDWLGIIYLHYLRDARNVKFDAFACFQLELFVETLAPYIQARRPEWYNLWSGATTFP